MSKESKIHFQKGTAQFLMGIDNVEQLATWLESNPGAIGFAMVGRSNVGKSSLVNSFFGAKTARVSKTPGRTRQINIFKFKLNNLDDDKVNEFYFYDLPGYGHANVSKQMIKNWQELINAFFHYAPTATLLLNIQDARHPDQKSDQLFHDYIKPLQFPTYLLFNKMDKLKKQKERAALTKIKPKLFKAYKWVKQIFFISAESRLGLEALEDALVSYLTFQEQVVFESQGDTEE